jgi:pimeloyl-ACP methyl ester carboxylesterase
MEKALTIYLLRGLSREAGHWGDFDQYVFKSFPNCIIHYVDMPGAGIYHSQKSPTSIPEIVHQLKAITPVEKGNNLLIASSLGGMVAIEWVTQFPEDFQYLVTVCSSYRGICKPLERFNMKFALPILHSLISMNMAIREKVILRINSNDVEKRKLLLEPWLNIQTKRRMSKSNFIRQVIAAFKFQPSPIDRKVSLLIVGSKMDQLVCESCIVKAHRYFGGTLIWHSTSGHCIPIDAPDWLAENIRSWFLKQQQHD